MANIGFATISVIPSFKGIETRARVGLGVITKLGKSVGEDTGKQFTKGLENKINPDFRTPGKDAARDFAQAAESGAAPDFKSKGEESGGTFATGLRDKLKTGAKAALAAGGVAAAAILGKAFLDGLDKEVATDKLAAQLGGSDWAKGQGKIAGDLYLQGFGESVADPAVAVKLIHQFGLLSEDASNAAIEALGVQVLTFTDVLEQDLLPTTRAVSTLLRTGLADSAEHALDLLTSGIQQGADLGEDLLDTFNEYPTSFRELGLSGSDSMGLIVQGLKAGARNSDFLADALKEFGIRGQDATELSAEGFRTLGLDATKATKAIAQGGAPARDVLAQVLTNLRNMEDPVKRNAAAVALFGTKAEDLGDALFALDLDTATLALGNQEDATNDLGSAYDNARSQIETFKREALDRVTQFIGTEAIPALIDFKDWTDQNTHAAMLFGGALAFVAAMLLLAGAPIIGTVLILGVLAAGVIYAYTHFKTFRDVVDNVVEGLGIMYDKVQTVLGALHELIKAIGDVPALLGLGDSFGQRRIEEDLREKGLIGPGGSKPYHGVVGGLSRPRFADGGVMPGARGVHNLAWVAGGETVLPTHKPGWSMPPMAGGYGDGLEARIVLDAPGGESAFKTWVLKTFRNDPAFRPAA